jgi:hypothetical protein
MVHSPFRESIIQVVGHACVASISRSSLIFLLDLSSRDPLLMSVTAPTRLLDMSYI